MSKKTNNIFALLTCIFIIFASFWCMSLPQENLQSWSVLASAEPGGWDLDDENTGLVIEGNEAGVEGEQTVYTGEQGGLIGFLNRTVNFAVVTVGSLAILGVIVGGIMLIVGSMRGNEEGIATGKEAVKYSLIGLALVFLSYFIISVVQTILYS